MTTITGRPVSVNYRGHTRQLSDIRFSGPGRPTDAAPLLAALKGRELKRGLLLEAGQRHFVLDDIEGNGTPVISLANTDYKEHSEGNTSFAFCFDRDTATVYLQVRTADYFGLSQEVTYAAIAAGLKIAEIGGRHKRLANQSQVDLVCRLETGETRSVEEIFSRFRAILSERIAHFNNFAEGSKILFTYRNLTRSIGTFFNTLPKLPDSPLLGAEAVEGVLQKNPELTKLLIEYLRIKFDSLFSRYYGRRESDLRSLAIRLQNEIKSVEEPADKFALEMIFKFVLSVENTNAFDINRNPEMVIFKLNHEVIQEIADHLKITYPTDITYVFSPRTGSFAIGARYGGEVSKGGDRYNATSDNPNARNNFVLVSRGALEDALRLAYTQETKNLLWGCYVNGLKTVLVAAPPVGVNAPLEDVMTALQNVAASRAYLLIRDALQELKPEEDLDRKIEETLANGNLEDTVNLLKILIQLELLVNLSLGEIYLGNLGDKRPGPDVNMSPFHMEFLTTVAKHQGVRNWPAIYTGKGAEFGGFPHAKLRVTGRGIFTNMLIALKKLGIDPVRNEVTATIQGFGDVGSSMTYFILTERPQIKITAISDLTGMLVCPAGIAARPEWQEEILRLVREGKNLSEFSPKLLRNGIEFRGKDRIDEIVTLPSTIFIPAATSNVVNERNVAEVLRDHALVVEAANIPFSVPAAQEFDQAGGKRIPGDFANGGGVFTSTDEILAIQILGREEFTDPERYQQLVADNEALIIRGAEENSWYLWEQYTRAEGRINFVELVQRVTRSMTVVKSIVKVSRLDYNSEDVLNFLFDSLFPSIVETTDRDEIIERLGPSIVKELIAAQLARKIIFANYFAWFEGIEQDQRDEVVFAEAQKLIAERASFHR